MGDSLGRGLGGAGGWAVHAKRVQMPDNLLQLDHETLPENPAFERQHLEQMLRDWYEQIRNDPTAWNPLPWSTREVSIAKSNE